MITHLVCDLIVGGTYGYEYARGDTVYVLNNTVLVHNTAIFLQLAQLIQSLNIAGLNNQTVSADHIGDQTGSVGHSGHLNHRLGAILKCAQHLRAHLTTSSFSQNSVRIAVVIQLVVLALTHYLNIHAHCLSKGVQMHNSTGLVTVGTGVDHAVLVTQLLQIGTDNDIGLYVQHYAVLLVLHGGGSHVCAYIRNTGSVDHTLYQVGLRDHVSILSGNVLALLHQSVSLFQSLSNSDVILSNTSVLECVDSIVDHNIRNDAGLDTLHHNHLRYHAAAHLTGTNDTRNDLLAILFALNQFLIQVQHFKFASSN